jgi:hypothetical protein
MRQAEAPFLPCPGAQGETGENENQTSNDELTRLLDATLGRWVLEVRR